MVESERINLVAGSFSTLLVGAWQKWDVRGMALFSLTLQIVLSVLGWWRKYTINSFCKYILLFAFLSTDWIAIATLGKLSSSCTKSLMTAPISRTYWAPLLLLHLGGPDSITAYALEDNKNWIRHLLILLIKLLFVITYFSRLSFLTSTLFIAGISKNIEKIWCLKLNNSQKAKPVINFFNPQQIPNPNENQTLDHLLENNPNVLRGYLLFTIMRPDVNDYLSSHNLVEVRTKITTHLKETTSNDIDTVCKYICASQKGDAFGAVAVALGFTFDVVYTKAALIYMKFAWLTRLTIVASCYPVLVIFFISIIIHFNFSLPKVDIAITGILLIGAYGLQAYAIMLTYSSNWAVLLVKFYHNKLLGKVFNYFSKLYCLFMKFHRPSKRRPDHMGQFDLLEYCCHYKKRKANQSCGILWKITNWSKIEMCHKTKFAEFVNVPNYLKKEDSYKDLIDSFLRREPFKMSRGEKALKDVQQFNELKWSIELEFDHSIIVWHLATSICYLQEDHDDDEACVEDHDDEAHVEDHDDKAKGISKCVSDYMMYLLVMCPTLLMSKRSKSFWLDHNYDKLKELLSSATDTTNAASTLLNLNNVDEDGLESSCGEHEEEVESRGITLEENLQKDVSKLTKCLKTSKNKWKMIRDVWMEMLIYAAVSSQHITHVKHLGEGIEFLSLIWLLIGSNTIRIAFKGEFEAMTNIGGHCGLMSHV